jgi:hypothetical protein
MAGIRAQMGPAGELKIGCANRLLGAPPVVCALGCALRCFSSGASRTSYAADLRASRDSNPDASGKDTTIYPTRTQRRARRSLRRAVRARTTDSVRTTTHKHWSPAEQVRCRALGRQRREAVSCRSERSTATGYSPSGTKTAAEAAVISEWLEWLVGKTASSG